MAWWQTARGAREGWRTTGAATRDAAYQMAGKITPGGRAAQGHAQRQYGRRNLIYGAGGLAGAQVVKSGRSSTARDGIQPNSMGGTTL